MDHKCGHSLSLDFIASHTPKVFHNEQYRKHRTDIELSKERSLLPGTQHLVENRHKAIGVEKEIREACKQEAILKQQLHDIKFHRRTLERRHQELMNVKTKDRVDKAQFIKACSVENCRGFLSAAWKCGTCQTYACSKCHEVKDGRDDEHHVCEEGNVATAKMLASSTKPCPKCAAPIYKVSGCSQMFCVCCHTVFNYHTGQLEKGIVHNPHYYEWQRKNNNGEVPRVVDDDPCGAGQHAPRSRDVRIAAQKRKDMLFKGWEECYRSIYHFHDVVMPRYPAANGVLDNTDLRVHFLMNETSEKEWASTLQKRVKQREKNVEIRQVIEMYTATLGDLFHAYIAGHMDLGGQCNAIREYANDQLTKIGKRYGNKAPLINVKWFEAKKDDKI
jgi:hypothetical protein